MCKPYPYELKNITLVMGVKHVLSTTYVCAEARMEAIMIELFLPDTLVNHSSLKMSLLYVCMRHALRFLGIVVE
jgi:hypothetical protein